MADFKYKDKDGNESELSSYTDDDTSKLNTLVQAVSFLLEATNASDTEKFMTTNSAQSISGLKTFSTLPQSSAVPSDDKDLVNKKYVDDAVPTNMVTTDTQQTVSGVKTFSNIVITNSINLNGYTLTIE